MRRLLVFSLLLICFTWPAAGTAQPAEPDPALRPVRVAIKPLPPFVFSDQAGGWVGFSMDLWEEIARRAGFETIFVEVQTVQEQIAAVAEGSADFAIAGITITSAREQIVDFSAPMFIAGLDIMSRPSGAPTLFDSLGTVLRSSVGQMILILVIVIIVAGHVVWLIERGRDNEFSRSYIPGIWEGIWWAAVTVVTVGYGDKTPKSALGRLIAILWMFFGVVLIAQFTAVITTDFTLSELRGSIQSPNDLYGKRVATVQGSTADEYLTGRRIAAQRFTAIDEAYALLENGAIDAIVYDAPVLLYHEANAGRGRVQVTGTPFDLEFYGIAMPAGSPDRERVNAALLSIYEDGFYSDLYSRWFSASD
jgi:polar amino acid transport system substrate-binding protein